MDTPAFCPHPGDLENCRNALVRAWREDRLAQHCIMNGLAVNWPQCRQVLLEGAEARTSRRGADDPAGATVPASACLERAREEAILLGYRTESTRPATESIFYERYHRLIRYMIGKFGIPENGRLTPDDVFQEVCWSLHKRLKKGLRLKKGSLPSYISSATVRACLRAAESGKPLEHLVDEGSGVKSWPPPKVPIDLPLSVLTALEDLDRRLATSQHGDIINRIILAHRGLEGWRTGERNSVEVLQADWRTLAGIAEEKLASLHEQASARSRRFPSQAVVHLAAEMMREALLQPWQVAVVFAAGEGLDLKATRELLDRLAGLSAGAIYTRNYLMYGAIGRKKKGGNGDEGSEDEGAPNS